MSRTILVTIPDVVEGLPEGEAVAVIPPPAGQPFHRSFGTETPN